MSENWNDSGVPPAYFITFRCYGTWLHGDERGSVDRDHNSHGSPRCPHRELRKDYAQGLLKQPPVLLDASRRRSVEAAIRETCEIRNWILFAINIRTNHGHSVVKASGKKPSAVMTAFKANATRQMRIDGCWESELSPWAEKGSIRYLWTDESVARAVNYVLYGQGMNCRSFRNPAPPGDLGIRSLPLAVLMVAIARGDGFYEYFFLQVSRLWQRLHRY